MEKMQHSIIFASQVNSAKIATLMRKIHQALDVVYMDELGHKCTIPDDEIIGDALRDYLVSQRKAIRVIRERHGQRDDS